MKIPYVLPYIGEEEMNEVVMAMRSNWLSKGPRTIEFEAEFAKFVGSKYAVALNSCTAGLHIAQLALGIGPGDEVITTPFTFVSTANTILHCGATPVFVDIDPVTLNIRPDLAERAITPRTKAIIPVHYAGYPCEMDQLTDIARKYDLKVIEDAAHAVDAAYKGRPVGSIGDVTCFSFYATKNLTTGEGGMITTDDEELAHRMRVMSLHGMSRNAWNRYTEKGSWYYEVEHAGFKYNMTDMQAAMGLVQLRKIKHMQQLRNSRAQRYNERFADCEELILPHDSAQHRHAWHLYTIRLRVERLRISRDEMIEQLGEAGIGVSVHFIPVPLHPFYREKGYRIEDFPAAASVFEGIISLPLYPGMSEEQVDVVADTVRAIIEDNRR